MSFAAECRVNGVIERSASPLSPVVEPLLKRRSYPTLFLAEFFGSNTHGDVPAVTDVRKTDDMSPESPLSPYIITHSLRLCHRLWSACHRSHRCLHERVQLSSATRARVARARESASSGGYRCCRVSASRLPSVDYQWKRSAKARKRG
jgi:hypothetical protein